MSIVQQNPHQHLNWAPFFAILAMAMVGTSVTVEGPIISYGGDSASYSCISANFARGNGLVNCTGVPLTGQPPLLPMVVGALLALGLGVIDAARILCVATAGLAGYCATRLLGMARLPTWLFVLAATMSVVHPPLVLWQTVGVMTDGPYAALVVATLLTVTLYLQHPDKNVAAVALCLALCAGTRYFGVAIVAFAGLAILSPLNPRNFPRRLRDGILASAPAIAIAGLWMYRSWTLTGCPTSCANWKGTPAGFMNSVVAYGNEIGGWLFYLPQLANFRWLLFYAAMIAVIGSLALLSGRLARPAKRIAWLAMGLIAVYSAFTLAVFSALFLDEPMNQRYVLPLAPVVAIPIAVAIHAVIPQGSGRWEKWIAAALALVWLGWLAAPVRSVWATMFHTHGLLALGPTTTSRIVVNSDFVRFLKTDLPEKNVFAASDLSQAFILIHTGRIVPQLPPHQPMADLTIVDADLPGGVAVGGRPDRYAPPASAKRLFQGEFGAVYQVSP